MIITVNSELNDSAKKMSVLFEAMTKNETRSMLMMRIVMKGITAVDSNYFLPSIKPVLLCFRSDEKTVVR